MDLMLDDKYLSIYLENNSRLFLYFSQNSCYMVICISLNISLSKLYFFFSIQTETLHVIWIIQDVIRHPQFNFLNSILNDTQSCWWHTSFRKPKRAASAEINSVLAVIFNSMLWNDSPDLLPVSWKWIVFGRSFSHWKATFSESQLTGNKRLQH